MATQYRLARFRDQVNHSPAGFQQRTMRDMLLARERARPWVLWLSPALLGCSPTCLLELTISAPNGLTLAPEKLFVTGVKACPPAPVQPPAPDAGQGDAEYVRARNVPAGVDVTAAFRGQHCRVQVTAWYDTNANGNLDAGDWLGSSAALDIRDEGLFGENSARAPDVMLEPRI